MTGERFDPGTCDLVLLLLRAAAGDDVTPREAPTAGGLVSALRFAGAHRVDAALATGARRAASRDPRFGALLPFLEHLEAANAVRNRRLRDEAVRVVAELAAASIPCVLLKGAAILAASDDAAPWRQLEDVDILVAPDAVEEAARTLQRSGFAAAGDERWYNPRLHHHHVGLYHTERDVLVELHTRLMQAERDDLLVTGRVLEHALAVGRGTSAVRVPCPEHRMVHLIAHAQISDWGHALGRLLLKDVLDARMLEVGHAIDWNSVEDCFASVRQRPVLEGFRCACRSLLGSGGTLPSKPDQESRQWAAWAIRNMTEPEAAWRVSMRIAGCYVRHAWRNPGRLAAQARTLFDPERRRHWLAVNRQRMR